MPTSRPGSCRLLFVPVQAKSCSRYVDCNTCGAQGAVAWALAIRWFGAAFVCPCIGCVWAPRCQWAPPLGNQPVSVLVVDLSSAKQSLADKPPASWSCSASCRACWAAASSIDSVGAGACVTGSPPSAPRLANYLRSFAAPDRLATRGASCLIPVPVLTCRISTNISGGGLASAILVASTTCHYSSSSSTNGWRLQKDDAPYN